MSGTRVVHVNDRVSDAVYIGRAMPRNGLKASPLANPFRIGPDMTRAQAIDRYEGWLMASLCHWSSRSRIAEALIACRDKPLACWCRHDGMTCAGYDINGCHGDVIVSLLDRLSDEDLRLVAGGRKQP